MFVYFHVLMQNDGLLASIMLAIQMGLYHSHVCHVSNHLPTVQIQQAHLDAQSGLISA